MELVNILALVISIGIVATICTITIIKIIDNPSIKRLNLKALGFKLFISKFDTRNYNAKSKKSSKK